jgi:hypothetical protein
VPFKVAVGQKWNDCTVGEENGVLMNKDTSQPFSFSDACVKRGTTVAYDKEATKLARKEVLKFLTEIFASK